MHNPDFEVNIEIRDKAYVYSSEEKGIGGMPLGTGARHTFALWRDRQPRCRVHDSKRGVEIEAVHFTAFHIQVRRQKRRSLTFAGF